MDHLISWMLLCPLVGALVLMLAGQVVRDQAVSWVALASSLASSILGFVAIFGMHLDPEMQHVERFAWIEQLSIHYHMGMDGLNVLLVLLIAIVFPILIASEWKRTVNPKGMQGLLLLCQSASIGTVCAQDLFVLFFFWSLLLIPSYFIVGVWGEKEREGAAFGLILTGIISNAFFFSGLLLVYYAVDPHTFALSDFFGNHLGEGTVTIGTLHLPTNALAFGLFSVALALRAPIWPFHGWFVRACHQAPASVVGQIVGVATPITLYIFLRLSYSLFPEILVEVHEGLVILGTATLVAGCIGALAQRGLRGLVAFIALSEVGLILIGMGSIESSALVGSVYHLLGFGLGITTLILGFGFLANSAQETDFKAADGSATFGGLSYRTPVFAVTTGFAIASLLGFPGSAGFVGRSLVFIGGFIDHSSAMIVAGVCVVFAVYYLFQVYRFIFLGTETERSKKMVDLGLRERAYLLPLVILIFCFGIYPKPWIDLVRPAALTLLSVIK